MSKIDIENVIKHIDLEKVKKELSSGKSNEEILKDIDLRPIIKEEMVKSNPNVTDEEVETVVNGINFVEIIGNVLGKKAANSFTGQAFDDLSVEDMMQLQGAGDVDVEATPTTVTLSSYPCLAYISGVSALLVSMNNC